MRAPTTPVICSSCQKELRGSECADGFRVRRHRDSVSERWCQGAYRVDHQPVVVFRRDTLDVIVARNQDHIERIAS